MSQTYDPIEVPKEWAGDLLRGGHCPTTAKDCWTLLEEALKSLQFAVALSNEHLDTSTMTDLVVEKMAQLKNADPEGIIYVSEDGEILFGSEDAQPSKPRGIKTRRKRAYRSALPSLGVMRQEAAKLGLDITKMGRKRRQIWAAIQAAKDGTAVSEPEDAPATETADEKPKRAPRRKMIKTAPAIAVNPNPGIFPPEQEVGDLFDDAGARKAMLEASSQHALSQKAAELNIEDILSEDSE
jgi:hypothetical protein